MSDLGLTPEERAYVERLAVVSSKAYLAFYTAVILPLLAFAGYGIAKRDFVAELIAFGGLCLFVLWRISYEIARVPLCRSAFRKIVEHERRPSLGD
jgi:hypothetical protein